MFAKMRVETVGWQRVSGLPPGNLHPLMLRDAYQAPQFAANLTQAEHDAAFVPK
jgi:hypothetical protein